MTLKPFQKHDYARLALAPGAILSHDIGLGKTWAAYCWAFLKVDYTVTPIHRHADSPTQSSESGNRRNGEPEIQIIPKAPVLIIEPGDLHKQFIDEGQRIFKTHVTVLDSQDTFLRLSKLDPVTGRRSLPPGFYISYTQQVNREWTRIDAKWKHHRRLGWKFHRFHSRALAFIRVD